MELRDWAKRILSADTLEEKLLSPQVITDREPGVPLFWKDPTRPPNMGFKSHSKSEKLPPFHEHNDPNKIAICLHRFAGHELLAVEMMAFALLAFPNAPTSFRRGVAHTLKEEQQHVKLYIKRMKELGISFGDLPLYRHFWAHTPYIKTPENYVSMVSLTFEQANLDFAPHYGLSFARNGDYESAKVMEVILADEIRHVSFGMKWLQSLKPQEEKDLWSFWQKCQKPFLHPKRATGFIFSAENRRKAAIPQDWITRLSDSL